MSAADFKLTTPVVSTHELGLSFGIDANRHEVLADVNVTIAPGEFLCVVGPTGCGKSSLLNLLAGLIPPTTGEVRVGGDVLRGLNPVAGYLLQGDALLPWRTARDNIALGLQFRGATRLAAHSAADRWLARVGLADAAHRHPHALSGGMKKRVALAQVLAVDPRLLLLDEPFSALDVQTRALMEAELLRLWTEERRSVVFITHDLEEAIALGDRVLVMSAGPGSRPIAEFPIDLPRPRAVEEIRLTAEFLALRRQIWRLLKDEIRVAR